MKLFKRISAMMVSLLMAFAMIVPVAAEGNPKITIKNVQAGEQFNYVKIIELNNKTTSGWAFVGGENGVIANAFKTAFDNEDTNDILKQIIADKKANSSKLNSALLSVKEATLGETPTLTYDGSVTATADATTISIDNLTKGGYAIFGVDRNGEYKYNPMMAYVDNSEVEVTSKKETFTPSKTVDDETVEIGATETYTITTTVPFNNGSYENFYVIDTLTNADYVKTNGKILVTASLPGKDSQKLEAEVLSNNQIKVDLTAYTGFTVVNSKKDSSDPYANDYAGLTLTLTYTAIVTGQEVNNEIHIGSGNNDSKFGTSKVESYTTSITVTKTGDNDEKLQGAGFVVYKQVVVNGNTVNKYATFDKNGVLTGYVDNEADATEITTGTDGTYTVYGFDQEGINYFFKEVTAPEGYTVPEESKASKQVEFKDAREGKIVGVVHFTDTKVGALPETGGIGTTIFTVGGCAIMVVAAALFFMNKKKHEK